MDTRKEELKKLIIKGLIGMAVGVAIGLSTGGGELWSVLLFIICFTGVPYGWQLSGKVITFGVVGSLPIMIHFLYAAVGFGAAGGLDCLSYCADPRYYPSAQT